MRVYRVGLGTDLHRLAEPGPIMIGGVQVEHTKHAVGHSDADVLLHAVTDALLGATSMGDIGQLFPDTDPANRGRDSREMLRIVWERVTGAGWQLENLDCVIHAQRPRLAPHIPQMRENLAGLLAVRPDQVSIKAKTGEGVDAVGKEEAIAAQAVVLLSKTSAPGEDQSQ